MDLVELKSKFKIKHPLWIKVVLVASLLAMIVSSSMEITEETIAFPFILFGASWVFMLTLAYWFMWYIFRLERRNQDQIAYLYTQFANESTRQVYYHFEVKNAKDLPKDYFKYFPLRSRFKNAAMKCQLHLISTASQHQLYYVYFERWSGTRSATIVSSGLLYSIPSYSAGSRKKTQEIIQDLQNSKYQNRLHEVEYKDQMMIYYEMNQGIPTFRRYNEKEVEKVNEFANEVFDFFDRINIQSRKR